MTIDISLLREDRGGNPDLVRESERRRGRDPSTVDKIIEVDTKYRKALYDMEQAKKLSNDGSKAIGQRRKVDPKDACTDLVAEVTEHKKKIPILEKEMREFSEERDKLLHSIGNIVHESVPTSNDEADNAVVKKWGTFDDSIVFDGTPGKMHHHEVLAKLEGYDPKRGVEVAGHRAYFLKGYAVLLNQALLNYGLTFLRRRGYLPVQPPYMMKREVMEQTAELKDFEETLYHIPSKPTQLTEEEKREGKEQVISREDAAGKNDVFLIATSEQPISALHRDQFVDEKTLPYLYAGISTCFRKEAGSHGKDTWGIFRVHQFEKIEQFVYCSPEASWEMHDTMRGIAEDFLQSLKIPYRVVSIVSGALNDAAAKKYDIEAWFPGYRDYKELVSCSNCTDYQARELGCRLGHPKQGDREKKYVHMLNATLVATQRAICCVLENYQTPEGVAVPTVLQPYMDGLEFLPFPSN